jgi:hypothetical protein
LAEVTAEEVAEDYRRQLQEAAARRVGLGGFEGRDPVVWFDAYKDTLALEARQAGGTAGEIEEVLAGMREKIAAAPAGSKFDDPFSRVILDRLVEHIRRFCKAKEVPIRGGVVYGLSPIGGISALQRSVLGTDASIIELSVPLMRFCNDVSRLVSETVGHAPRPDGSWEVNFHPHETLVTLSSRPAVLESWIDLLSNYAVFGWLSTYDFEPMSTRGALQTRVHLTKACQLFAVAHEFGHHVFGHGEVMSSEGRSDPFQDEFEADSFAIEAGLDLARSETPANFWMQSGVGAVVLLVASELVGRTRDVLAHGTVSPPTDSNHPTVPSRVKHMGDVGGQFDQETSDRLRNARACFATILELVWKKALPAVRALHDRGLRPQEIVDPRG